MRRNAGSNDAGITIMVPVDLASEVFSETGDLPIGEFPALEKLAKIIAQVLNVGDDVQSSASLEVWIKRNTP